MVLMRPEKLRQVDLNLLIIFAVIAGIKRHQSVRPTIAQSTGGQPRPSVRASHISGRAGGSLVFGV